MAVTSAVKVIKMTAALDAVTGRQIVKSVRWVGGTTAGHQCILTDTAGNTIVSMVATGANFTDVHYFVEEWNGIIAATLGSGTVYIYIM